MSLMHRSIAGVALAILITLPMAASTSRAAEPAPPPLATAVWGQPSFLAHRCVRPTSMTLCAPQQATVDAQGDLWVADFDNNRVLMFPPGSAIAAKVFGQYGSFTSRGCNRRPPRGSPYPPAPNRYTLCQPSGVAVDANGTLYIADSIDNRVLIYFHARQKPADAPADLVLGQTTFHATASNDVPAGHTGSFVCPAPRPASPCTLNSPLELSVDAHGDLLVPDLDNHRVLLWPAETLARIPRDACARRCFLPAARVWGQYGSFRTNIPNNPAIPAGSPPHCTAITILTPANACTLKGPDAAIADAQGDLFVADTENNRVLEYDRALLTGRQDATGVYGQDGGFTSNWDNIDGLNAWGLWHPHGLALDAKGDLWVTDFYNMRVLTYPPIGSARPAVAEQVLGQDGGFGVHGCHWGAGGLCGPTSIAFDGAGDPVAADGFNSRVLEYADPHAVLARVGATAVSRQGHDLVVTWRMASQVGVRDFVLRAGESAALHIHLLAGGVYRSRLVGARGEVTLGVDLASGWRVSVGLRPVAGYAPGNRVGKSAVFAGS